MVEHTMTKETLENRLTALCGKEISACSEKELYTGLLSLVQEMAKDKESNQGKKKLYSDRQTAFQQHDQSWDL